MLGFVIQVVVVSIVVSILSHRFGLIPRYPERRYTRLVPVLNTGILTILLTLVLLFDLHPSWTILFALVFLPLVASVWFTNYLLRRRRSSAPDIVGRQG